MREVELMGIARMYVPRIRDELETAMRYFREQSGVSLQDACERERRLIRIRKKERLDKVREYYDALLRDLDDLQSEDMQDPETVEMRERVLNKSRMEAEEIIASTERRIREIEGQQR